ncbi:MAG TPA: T9SS type A sorting domain-containing protein [Bacteroidia bacterium]|jgi:hypothetical protein
MKKIFTSVFTIAFASFGFGQSLHIYDSGVDVTNTHIYDSISPFNTTTQSLDLTIHDLELHNVTPNTVSYKVNRTILNAPASMGNLYFCTGTQCYSPQSATTWTPGGAPLTLAGNATLPSGPGTYGIAAHYDADTLGTSIDVLYRVYNTAVAGDTAYVTIHYIGVATGITESAKLAGGNISAAYPNPASSLVSIKYDMNQYAENGKISFYDMLGKKVKEVVLTEKQGVAKVDVSELKSGIYFYSFLVNDKAVATKKLVISSK